MSSWIRLYLRELCRHPIRLLLGCFWTIVWWAVAGGLAHSLGNPLVENQLEHAGFRVQGPISTIQGESPPFCA